MSGSFFKKNSVLEKVLGHHDRDYWNFLHAAGLHAGLLRIKT